MNRIEIQQNLKYTDKKLRYNDRKKQMKFVTFHRFRHKYYCKAISIIDKAFCQALNQCYVTGIKLTWLVY